MPQKVNLQELRKAKYQRKRFGIWWNVKANKIWIDYAFEVRQNSWNGPSVFSHNYTVEEINAHKAEIEDFETFCAETRLGDPWYCVSDAVFDTNADGYLNYNCEISLDNGGCQYLW